MLSLEQLEEALARLPRMTIAVVGDLFLDRYLHLEPGVRELSIETGLEAFQISRVRNSPGAMGTLLNNLAALGAGLLTPISVIGDDGHGFDLLRELRKLPLDPTHILCTNDRLTPTYTKPLRQGDDGVWNELNRLDVRTREPIHEGVTAEVCRRMELAFQAADALLVLDQINEDEWGVVNAAVRETLAACARKEPQKLIFVDSRRRLGKFGCGVLKGNRSEVLLAAGFNPAAAETALGKEVEAAAQTLADKTKQPVFTTLGEEGILVASAGKPPQVAPGVPVAGPVDIVGAGDSASSGMVAGLLAGLSPLAAATLGNLVASITVQQLGTTGVATPAQVRERLRTTRRQ